MQGSLGKKIRLAEFAFVWNNRNYIPLNSKISVRSLSTMGEVWGYLPRKGQTRMNREGLTRHLQSRTARFSIVAMLEGGKEGQLRGAASSPELCGFSDSHGLYSPDNRTFPPPSLPRQPGQPPRHPARTAEPHSHRWGPAGRGGQCGDTPGQPVSPRTASAPQHRPGSARAADWLVQPAAQPMGRRGSPAIHENPAGPRFGCRSRRPSVPGASLRVALGTRSTG